MREALGRIIKAVAPTERVRDAKQYVGVHGWTSLQRDAYVFLNAPYVDTKAWAERHAENLRQLGRVPRGKRLVVVKLVRKEKQGGL